MPIRLTHTAPTSSVGVVNLPIHRKAGIIVAGRNFGVGSSRETAVFGLVYFGIRCVIGHPDDAAYIGALQEHGRELKVKIRYGPYRGNREPGFFDWSGRSAIRPTRPSGTGVTRRHGGP